MNEQIDIINNKINDKRIIMDEYFEAMHKAHIQNQADKASAYAAMVYAAKSMIDDYNEQIINIKGV